MEIILFLAGVFLVTFAIGRLLEKFRIPWIFSAMIIGVGLAANNPFKEVTSSQSFLFLAELGMYFLLFIIGFEIDFEEIRKRKKFIVKTTMAIIFAEALVGSLFIHYVFDISWIVSALVASSFATVGEAILIPILDEFKLTKKPLGQTIIGIGVLDDVVEVITVILISILIGTTIGHPNTKISVTLGVLFSLFSLAFFLTKWKHKASRIEFRGVASFFLFVIFFIFLFIGIGRIADMAALGALLAGISLKNFIPEKRLEIIDSEIRTLAYGLFSPIFFLWVGLDTNVRYLAKYFFLVLAVILISNITKIITSYIMGKKVIGKKKSIILGISLTVKFSTSIVIIKLLFEKGLIPITLYSVLVGSTILFKFIVPVTLSYLIKKWKIH